MSERDRVGELDLLRFAAALSVVLFHYTFRGHAADHLSSVAYPAIAPIAQYGDLGVELFFMISGFVILMTASRSGVRQFLASRAARLYPAFWICCTITFLFVVLVGDLRPVSTREYALNMTMLSGFADVRPIDGVYWTLVVEMRFYVLIAVVLLVRQLHHVQHILIAWLFAAAALTHWPVPSLTTWLLVPHAGFFIGGATCFLIRSKGLSIARGALLCGAWALAMIHSLSALPGKAATYSTSYSRWAVGSLVTGFFVAMLAIALRRTGPLRHRRWLALGALTYPLYLVHQRVGYMMLERASDPYVGLAGTFAVMLALAYVVSAVFERRMSPLIKRALGGR